MEAGQKAHPVSRYAATAIALLALWILLTSTVFDEYLAGSAAPGSAVQEIAAGVLVSLLLAFWACRYLTVRGLSIFSPKRWLCLLIYIPVFFCACIKANLDVAYRVVHPKMPINPGVVAIRTTLTSDVAKLMLANSITLTPGTLTLDVSEEYLFIHWINVESTDVDEASRLIGGRFEKYLKVIAE
ncbi:MAG: Na+/H+ antiporter subunit E [Phycisphaerae bacterium]